MTLNDDDDDDDDDDDFYNFFGTGGTAASDWPLSRRGSESSRPTGTPGKRSRHRLRTACCQCGSESYELCTTARDRA
eukprot:136262-Rhodomonas_salina.3